MVPKKYTTFLSLLIVMAAAVLHLNTFTVQTNTPSVHQYSSPIKRMFSLAYFAKTQLARFNPPIKGDYNTYQTFISSEHTAMARTDKESSLNKYIDYFFRSGCAFDQSIETVGDFIIEKKRHNNISLNQEPALDEQKIKSFDELPVDLKFYINKVQQEGFISAGLWSKIMQPKNITYYGLGWYSNLNLDFKDLSHHREHFQHDYVDPKNPTQKPTKLLYTILESYEKKDAHNSTEKAINTHAVPHIYKKVVDQLEDDLGVSVANHDAEKIVRACPSSAYVLDAFKNKYTEKEHIYCGDATNTVCKLIREQIKLFDETRKKFATPTVHQA